MVFHGQEVKQVGRSWAVPKRFKGRRGIEGQRCARALHLCSAAASTPRDPVHQSTGPIQAPSVGGWWTAPTSPLEGLQVLRV